jgi:prepilin-type N-terminal cleavage/methylation domain-containing protein
MPRDRLSRQTGFTLIEVMAAMAVVAFASMGVFGGINYARQELNDGQIRQFKMVLLDAKAQRLLGGSKQNMSTSGFDSLLPTAIPSTPPGKVPIGANPWVPDNTTPVSGDISSGAYFKIRADGTLTADTTVPAGTACNSSLIPVGTYCREVMITNGTPSGTSSFPTNGVSAVTLQGAAAVSYWTRISRMTSSGPESTSRAIVHKDLIIQ